MGKTALIALIGFLAMAAEAVGTDATTAFSTTGRVENYVLMHTELLEGGKQTFAWGKGLVGDGVHDDTAVIQAMLDAGRSCVYLPPPPKEYRISKALELSSGQELRLDRFTTVRLAPNSGCAMVVNRHWRKIRRSALSRVRGSTRLLSRIVVRLTKLTANWSSCHRKARLVFWNRKGCQTEERNGG